MHAMTCQRYGSPDVFQASELPPPVLQRGQLRIRNYATSVNPVDWKIRSGEARIISGLRPPQVLGADFAGEVLEVNPEITAYAVGDRVYGMLPAFRGGAYADTLVCHHSGLAPLPASLDYPAAAALPLVGLTAYQALVYHGRLQAGDTVVVNGASGGVGHVAVQIANALGAQVIAVCSERNAQTVSALGAHQVLDYQQDPQLASLQGVDIFFDAVANRTFQSVRRLLSCDGRYISTLPTASLLLAPLLNWSRAQSRSFVSVKSRHRDLVALTDMIDAGKLKPLIEQVLPLSNIAEAHRISEAGRVVGKLVLSTDKG